jgi:hypothetical protein
MERFLAELREMWRPPPEIDFSYRAALMQSETWLAQLVIPFVQQSEPIKTACFCTVTPVVAEGMERSLS